MNKLEEIRKRLTNNAEDFDSIIMDFISYAEKLEKERFYNGKEEIRKN